MEKFKFYQDSKMTLWQRQYFEVEAKNKHDALEIVKRYADKDVSDILPPSELMENEKLLDTEEFMLPEENLGGSTMDIFDASNDTIVVSNVPIGFSIRAVVGWGPTYPKDLSPELLFKTKHDACKWAEVHNIDINLKDWCIKAVYGNAQDYTFITI